jgi:hypothetical protein
VERPEADGCPGDDGGSGLLRDVLIELDALVSEGFAYDLEWGRALSSHDTMTLVALARLADRGGWGAARVGAFARGYRQKLRPAAPITPPLAALEGLEADDAWALAGDYTLLPDFTRWLGARIAREGAEPVAREALERLGRGMPGAAGHGLLRVAFAFELRADVPAETFHRELARALGYFAARSLVLAPRGAAPVRDLDAGLATTAPLPETRRRALRSLGLISLQHAALARGREPAIRDAFAEVGPPSDPHATLAHLAGIAATTPDFTLLHALTTGHAILALSSALPGLDTGELFAGWSHFVLAASLVQALPRDCAPVGPPPELRALLAPIATTADDHAPKAAFALLALHDATGDAGFLAAAKSYVDAYA